MNPILSQTREWLIQPEALRSMAIAAFSAFAGAGGGERKFPAPVAVSGRNSAGRALGRAALQAGPRAIRVTVDAGREAQQNRADVEMGLKTLSDHFAELGADFGEEIERRVHSK